MQAAQLAGPEGKVLAIEPVPETFAALEHNIQAHAAWAERQGRLYSQLHAHRLEYGAGCTCPKQTCSVAAGLQIAPVTCCRTAVGANSIAEVQLTFYPSASGWSTMYPDDEEVLSAMDVFLEKSLSSLKGIDATPWAKIGQVLQKGAPEWLSKRLQRCVGMSAWLGCYEHANHSMLPHAAGGTYSRCWAVRPEWLPL